MGGVAVRVGHSRVLPGHRYWRVDRLGDGMPEEALEKMISALGELARDHWRVLKLSVRVFSPKRRREIADLLARAGYVRSVEPLAYRHTLTIDLERDEEAIFRGLHKTARKNIRHAQHSALTLESLTDPSYANRIRVLQEQAMARTGGPRTRVDWRSLLDLSRAHPEMSRMCGLFRADGGTRPADLLAFAWGTIEGDHGSYAAAGAMRSPD